MILALDTSTAACTAALLEKDGTIVASCDEVIGRGHAERLVPMIEEMLDGMAIGWSIPLTGMNSLALLAASAPEGEGKIAAAMAGGHGELFVQTFNRKKLTATGPIQNLTPQAAALQVDAPLVVGSGAEALVAARHTGEALPLLPSATRALALPELLRALECKPIYARAPDARPKAA